MITKKCDTDIAVESILEDIWALAQSLTRWNSCLYPENVIVHHTG